MFGPMNWVWAVCMVCCVSVCGVVFVGLVFMFVPYLLVIVFMMRFSLFVSVVGLVVCFVRSCVRYLFGIRVLLCSCPMHLLGRLYFLFVLSQVVWQM